MKAVMELFEGDAVKFFGIDKKIIATARTELSHLELKKNVDDWIFEADDKSFIHFEFQSTLKKDDLKRFLVSDAIFYYKNGRPINTIVVYSGDIEKAKASLDCGSIQYEVEPFYLVKLDGDVRYDELRKKVAVGEKLTKQDLMSIVFLPLMKNSVDIETRLEQSVNLSKEIKGTSEQLKIQAMINLLVEKFIADEEKIRKLKEVLNMTKVMQMMRDDIIQEIVINALKKGAEIDFISDITGLETERIQQLQAELNNQ
jgi:molybdopterin converting factor small subunit